MEKNRRTQKTVEPKDFQSKGYVKKKYTHTKRVTSANPWSTGNCHKVLLRKYEIANSKHFTKHKNNNIALGNWKYSIFGDTKAIIQSTKKISNKTT